MSAEAGGASSAAGSRATPWLPGLALLVLPALVLAWGAGDFLGSGTVDHRGHVWVMWSVSQGEWPRTELVAAPAGVDLLPIVGGWLDLWIGALLALVLPLHLAWNGVLAVYLLVAGLGGTALARVAGSSLPLAWLGGLLLQLDGFLWKHLLDGRPEQAGLGFLALAVAAAVRCWRTPGAGPALTAGLAGALVVFVSWELTLFLGLTYACLAVALLASTPDPRAPLRRAALAAAAFLFLAGPWAAHFLLRTAAVRDASGDFGQELSQAVSVGVLDWWMPGLAHTPVACLLLLPVVPFLVEGGRRRFVLVVALGLALSLVLAWGPAPRLSGPPMPNATAWGPFAVLGELPVLRWFHWPDRLVVGFSLAGPAAAVLVVGHLLRRRLGLGLALGGLVLGLAVAEFALTRPPKAAALTRAVLPALEELRALPEEGALLEVPAPNTRADPYASQLLQLQHGRPLHFHSFEPALVGVSTLPPLVDFEAWAAALGARGPRSAGGAAPSWSALRDLGYRFLALHQEGLPRQRWKQVRRQLVETLGEPFLAEGERWLCWRLPGQDAPPRAP